MSDMVCNNHPKCPAIFCCNKYPCKNFGMCTKCAKSHDLNHAFREINNIQSDLEMYKQRHQDFLEKTSKVSAHLERLKRQNEHHEYEEIERQINSQNDFFSEAIKLRENELDFLKGKKIPTEEYKGIISDIENYKFNIMKKQKEQLYKNLTKFYDSSFFSLIKPDLSNTILYYDIKKGCIVVLLPEYLYAKSIGLYKYGIRSYEGIILIRGPAIERISNVIYIFGGFSLPNSSGAAVKLTFAEKKFDVTKLKEINHKRWDMGICSVVKKYIFLISGSDNIDGRDINIPYVERYDIFSNTYTDIPSVNFPRALPGVCVFNERWIYIYGGEPQNQTKDNIIEVYDILEDAPWETIELSEDLNKFFVICQTSLMAQISPNELLTVISNSSFITTFKKGCMEKSKVETLCLSSSLHYKPMWKINSFYYFLHYRNNLFHYVDDRKVTRFCKLSKKEKSFKFIVSSSIPKNIK